MTGESNSLITLPRFKSCSSVYIYGSTYWLIMVWGSLGRDLYFFFLARGRDLYIYQIFVTLVETLRSMCIAN